MKQICKQSYPVMTLAIDILTLTLTGVRFKRWVIAYMWSLKTDQIDSDWSYQRKQICKQSCPVTLTLDLFIPKSTAFFLIDAVGSNTTDQVIIRKKIVVGHKDRKRKKGDYYSVEWKARVYQTYSEKSH